jgi:type VII secretion protein EccE
LALLVIVPAAMAYPWQSTTDRWILGVAVVVVLALVAWWRGLFVTTMIGRRLAVWRRNHSKPEPQRSNKTTVLLRVEDPAGVGLSLPLVAGYIERFGVRCEKVRVTSRDDVGARTTWIGLTLDAVDNLAALQARSPELPLHDTAQIVGRRLADHLRETGLEAVIVNIADAPVTGPGREVWRGIRTNHGTVSAYEIPVGERLADLLAEVAAQPVETWAAVEFGGTQAHPTITAVCTFRTADTPRRPPLPGLVAHPGIQGPLLNAMDPKAVGRLGVPSRPLPAALLRRIGWRVGSPAQLSRT